MQPDWEIRIIERGIHLYCEAVMWKFWIIILCAAGAVSQQIEPTWSERYRTRAVRRNGGGRNFACPSSFVRLGRFCYYLSAGTASWRDAHFYCKDRNASLAVLDRKPKDRNLRKYLQGAQLNELERWIGGIYNWELKIWEWGLTSAAMKYQSFGRMKPHYPEQYKWHCAIMDPDKNYRWGARSCVTPLHYVCERPANRIGRRRRKLASEPENQRMKPRKRSKKYNAGSIKRQNLQNKANPSQKRRGRQKGPPDVWTNEINFRANAPSSVRWAPGARPSDRLRPLQPAPGMPEQWVSRKRVEQLAPDERNRVTYAAGETKASHSLNDVDNDLGPLQAHMNNLSMEEVLFKS